VGIAFTNYYYEAGGRLHERMWSVSPGRHERFLETVLRGCPIHLSVAVIRRSAWEEGQRRHPIGGDTWVDMTTWLRTAEAGWAFFFVDERLAVNRLHPGQVTRQEALMRDRAVRLWESFRFDEPECERLRLLRLEEALLARANLRLRRRDLRAALADMRAARATSPGRLGERGLVALLGLRQAAAHLLTRKPVLLRPALSAWRVLQRLDRFG
jgi:hypothetical protein